MRKRCIATRHGPQRELHSDRSTKPMATCRRMNADPAQFYIVGQAHALATHRQQPIAFTIAEIATRVQWCAPQTDSIPGAPGVQEAEPRCWIQLDAIAPD